MTFVNRTGELAALERWWASTDPRPVVVWGRRRVGKTALPHRFVAGRRSVFHTGAGRAARGELAQLSVAGSLVPASGTRTGQARSASPSAPARRSATRHPESSPSRPTTSSPRSDAFSPS
ncbi:ATP-binding protein [Frankia sp. CiP1_Cm_nod1]|uniref:ATP-binding protein n=1 Tax=Frankia sp. CiP1_Cm_nod1 TaxID=2897160 RepID=UPI00202448E9